MRRVLKGIDGRKKQIIRIRMVSVLQNIEGIERAENGDDATDNIEKYVIIFVCSIHCILE